MVRDWTAIRKIKQTEGETVADLMDRVEKVFKIHGGVPVPTDRVVQTPYEENLTAAFLDALADKISEFIETHCIGWRTARLDLIISHATHAENLFMKKEKFEKNRKEEITKKLQLAQLEALENPKPIRRNRDQRGDRPKEKRKENNGRWNCHYCGAKDHWIKDCPKRREEEHGADDWESAPSREVTVNHPKGKGEKRGKDGRGNSH
jgi:hypothetical protein